MASALGRFGVHFHAEFAGLLGLVDEFGGGDLDVALLGFDALHHGGKVFEP